MIFLRCSPEQCRQSGWVPTVDTKIMEPTGFSWISLRTLATRTKCCPTTQFVLPNRHVLLLNISMLRALTHQQNWEAKQTITITQQHKLELEFDITYNFVKDKRRNTWLKRLISTLKIMSNGVNLESNGGSVNSDGDNSIGEDGLRRKNSLERYRPGAYFNLVNSQNRCMSIWNEKRKINNSSTM